MTNADDRATASRPIGRRQMLARLGLAAGAAYMAPAMLSLSQARASGGGSHSGASSYSGGGGGRGGGRSGGSSYSAAGSYGVPRTRRATRSRRSSYSGPRRRLRTRLQPFLRRLFGI